MKKKTCYVTTPIYYSSGEVHIGNSYSTIVCDVFARYNRLKGHDTFFLTGMDEHGQKVEEAAKKNNVTPQEFVNKMAEKTQAAWQMMKITNNDFICTSQERHIKVVQKIFEKLLANDDIYLGVYEGNYCVPCESFFPKSKLVDGNLCPDCHRPTTVVKEETYFLRLKKYEKQLLQFIKENPDFIQPESRRNEVISFIEQGLEDLSVSRTTFKWGVPVLSNPKHVVYVWIDALSNYLSALGYLTDDDSLYQNYWVNGDEVVHVVGKDILRFHAVYWPIMLMALGVPIKFKLYAHGWWLMREGKMSKSRANVVYPQDLIPEYGLDALRLFLVKEMPLGNDSIFTYERFFEKYNADLANDLGNLVSRTISMVNKYFGGTIRKTAKIYTEFDQQIQELAEKVIKQYINKFDNFRFQDGLNAVWELISRANKYIDETTPWILYKDETRKEELENVLYRLVEVLRLVAIMISPVMVDTCETIFNQLGISNELQQFDTLKFGLLNTTTVVSKAEVLFKRLEIEKELAKIEKAKEKEKETTPTDNFKPEITIEDFSKLDLRIGKVIECKKDPNSDKLLILQVEINGKVRQIVSSIADVYKAEELVGKNIVVLANLKPTKIRGHLSEGMLLAASNEEQLEVLETRKVTKGTVD